MYHRPPKERPCNATILDVVVIIPYDFSNQFTSRLGKVRDAVEFICRTIFRPGTGSDNTLFSK